MQTVRTIAHKILPVCLMLGLLLLNSLAQSVATAQAALPNTSTGSWDPRFGALGPEEAINALAITANGDIYVGGNFVRVAGVDARHIARWDGKSWSAVGGGLDDTPRAMVADGNNLYVIGGFTTAGSVAVNQLARWDGTSWSAVGSGAGPLDQYESNGRLEALAVANGQVYVGGNFASYEGVAAINIARWDGTSWSAIGKGLGQPDTEGNLIGYGYVSALLVDGEQIYAGGDIGMADDQRVNAIAHWDGAKWQALGSGMTDNDYEATEWGTVTALAKGNGLIYAAGRFLQAGGVAASHIAAWNGSQWSPLGAGILDPESEWDVPVDALIVKGDTLYVGGSFRGVGGQPIPVLAQWRDNSWSQVGSGMSADSLIDQVYALALGADGSLYSGGQHQLVSGKRVDHLARWDGTNWHSLYLGLNKALYGAEPAEVEAIVEDEAGRVFAAGLFGVAGGNKVKNLAMLENGVWHNIGESNDRIYALALDGDYLYVGGAFTEIGGIPANHIARWHRPSGQWSTLGNGINGYVNALAVADGILYAGGGFSTAGTVNAADVAWWDGAAWHPFGTKARIFEVFGALELGTDVNALAVYGDLIIIGGDFTTIQFGTNTADRNSFVKVNELVAWDRTKDEWLSIGPPAKPGVTGEANGQTIRVNALRVIGNLLCVGGQFSQVGTQAATGLGCLDLVNNQWLSFNANLDSLRAPSVNAISHYGADLLVGGNFLSAGDAGTVNFVGRLNLETETWSALDGGVKWVNDLDTEVLSLSASATGVYVGGKFSKAGGFSAPGFARWNGELGGDAPNPTPNPNPNPGSEQSLRLYLPLVQR